MKKATKAKAKELRSLRRMKDADIGLSDIPVRRDWSKAVVGKFYRPIKESLTIRIDADVLAWLPNAQAKDTRPASTVCRVRRWRAAPADSLSAHFGGWAQCLLTPELSPANVNRAAYTGTCSAGMRAVCEYLRPFRFVKTEKPRCAESKVCGTPGVVAA